jgi:ornithine carbamoyltransferase
MHHLLRVADLESSELIELVELAIAAKRRPAIYAGTCAGRVCAVLFEKPSLRTRFSVEGALARLGSHPIGAYDREVGLGTRESLPDAARVLSRYSDAIVIRTFAHERVEELAEASDVPVVNALTDEHHPLQALADLMTVAEACCDGDVRGLKDVRIAYVGDGNNVCVSLIEGCALTGASLSVGCPPGHEPPEDITSWAREQGAALEISSDAGAAVHGADAVYTDVWTSMGQEDEAAGRRGAFEPYRVTQQLMQAAAPNAIFLHCLPAHRGEEVDTGVIDGPASRVFDQAENRLHTTLAVFVRLWGRN